MDLRHPSWLLERKNEVEPMSLSFFIPIGVFLLVAARRPSEHRSTIALAAWWNISHGVVMAIQTVEAWIHSVHRNFTLTGRLRSQGIRSHQGLECHQGGSDHEQLICDPQCVSLPERTHVV